ncbi:MAG: glycosyltransferase family 2 protein [Candidatus Nealsonbacteria bacterium]|nr:glycosyltransferase family 2 protein [Candidatus Nealsonbacteria bacterium]
MKLSIIIPVFNEEKTITQVLERVLNQEIGDWEKEIIVVDDDSSDGTARKLEPFFDRVRVFKHAQNRGKGAALQTGLGAAGGEAIIVQDADLEYDPADWGTLLRILAENPELAAVYGSRELSPERRGYFPYVLGVRFLTFLINLFFGSRLTDAYTGYKLFRAEAIKSINLKSRGFEIEAEITVKLLKGGFQIKEAPIHYRPRSFTEGKKIHARDGLRGLLTILEGWLKQD